MALTGQLIDLSLVELIEFFCSQRKSGRLKVMYPQSPAYFYIQQGTLVDAKIGSLSGVDAVYYAMTLENASFKFSAAFEPTRRTIHQPWTAVALEGLRRIDEGIKPSEPFSAVSTSEPEDESEEAETVAGSTQVESSTVVAQDESAAVPMSLMVEKASAPGRRNLFIFSAAAVVLLISVTALGSFAGWFAQGKSASAATASSQPDANAVSKSDEQAIGNSNPDEGQAAQVEASNGAENADASAPVESAAALAAKREREARERDRLKNNWPADQSQTVQPEQTQAAAPAPEKKPEPAKPAPKTVTVQVTYDEAGRVTQASGGDPTALRIARQKRFPAGKAGSTTVTIPIN